MKRVVIISGGTVSHIATHSALCAPAYGGTGRKLINLCGERWDDTMRVDLYKTRMAEPTSTMETNADVERLIDDLIADLDVKVIFMPVALCDFEPVRYHHWESADSWKIIDHDVQGRNGPRLKTSNGKHSMLMQPAKKLIQKIRAQRKDIFLVGFKATDGVDEQDQYLAGLNLLKASSCNLVLANDVKTRLNMIITPEEAKYHVTADRNEALRQLVDMTHLRSHLTFTRSTVVAGEPVPWDSPLVPESLRTVMNHCIEAGAYKPFRGATVGHFACNITELAALSAPGRQVYLTSRRKTNFNDLPKLGLVRIETDGPDTVLAFGSKPSVGGQSQRIVFSEHPEYDCIVHAHVPLRPTSGSYPGDVNWFAHYRKDDIPIVSQREYECGSHQCGQNTSRGLKRFGNLLCVMLDQHGPNIVFNSAIDPQEVIDFIDANFDLSQKTGGPV